MQIRDADLKAVGRLWRELAEFPAGEAAQARTHCMARLAEIVGAGNAFWVAAARTPGATRDRLDGWRPRALDRLHDDPVHDRAMAEVVREMDADIVDPMTLENVSRAGATRTFLRPELVADEVWRVCALFNEALRPSGIEDRLMGVHALDGSREAYLGLDRGPRERPFGERERDLLQLFLLGCTGFHREQFLVLGLDRPRLSPREQEVLSLLLTDLSEKQIGEALGLTWRTTHQYAVSIFRKFGVRGRLGLMAHWLRGDRAPPPAP